MTTYAHLFKARGRKGYDLMITNSPNLRGTPLNLIFVANKAEARKIAAQFDATPWNF